MSTDTKTDALATIRRLFRPLIGGGDAEKKSGDDAALESAYESVRKVAAVMNERGRLRGLEDSETGKIGALSAQLKETEAARIEALTEYRVSNNKAANERAQTLLKKCSEIQQEIDDAHGVARGVKSRIEALDHELTGLRRSYRGDLGVFLTSVYAGLIDRYNDEALGVAEIVLQIAAVKRVMLKYGAGNEAGFQGNVFMPGMRAGVQYSEPMLDGGSPAFDRKASDRMDGIVSEMNAAGFIFRLD